MSKRDVTKPATISLDQHEEWKSLQRLAKAMQKKKSYPGKGKKDLKELLKDNQRTKEFCLENNYLYFDYSKNWITPTILDNLFNLFEKVNLKEKIRAMFKGEPINFTEKRKVLHTAIRTLDNFGYLKNPQDESNLPLQIEKQQQKIKLWVDKFKKKKYLGFKGKPITDVVNLGIGGSYLGVKFLVEALAEYGDHYTKESNNDLTLHYISNIDGLEAKACLKKINLSTTLFIIVSKSFTTKETLENAKLIKTMYQRLISSDKAGGVKNKSKEIKKIYARHLIAVTAKVEKAKEFGIIEENIFAFADFIGGRYSVFSSVGLAVVLKIGYKNYQRILSGARSMDEHFLKEKFSKNLPVILAALSIWQINFLNNNNQLIIPYSYPLRSLPEYLQQLDMESNGKRINQKGQKVNFFTGPALWGGVGTNSQHSFFQSLHQGTIEQAIDFIGVKKVKNTISSHQNILMANMLAQGEALALGKTKADLINENPKLARELINHKVFPGNKSSNTLILAEITPEVIGYLIAMYEHKVFVQGAVWGINSFDQWGVELGKSLAEKLEKILFSKTNSLLSKPEGEKLESEINNDVKAFSTSTKELIRYLKK